MAPDDLDSTTWTCHWEQISGPVRNGRATRSTVWICEYPYRTMRATMPESECESCPIWRARRQALRAAAAQEIRALESLLAH